VTVRTHDVLFHVGRGAGEGSRIGDPAGGASRNGTLLSIGSFQFGARREFRFFDCARMKFKGHDDVWRGTGSGLLDHRHHRPSREYRPAMDFTGDAKMAHVRL